jgi:NAD(P)-dependent dehydrogenase (short-subunit alcohol dehydrogenase family)
MYKIILVTGGSSGIGKAIGEYLADKGYTVYGTSRDISKHPESKFRLLTLDVTNNDQINSCINQIINLEGRIDVLINNAGVGITGPLEETPEEEIHKHFKTNLYGPINMIKAVLPFMRKERNGLIINITSIAGYVGSPFRSIYSAGKAALDLISETLNMETKEFKINVVSIAPGDYLTNIPKGRFHSPVKEESPYKNSYKKGLETMNKHIDSGADPKIIGKLVYKILNSRNPKKKYLSGSFIETLAPFLKFILPQRLFEYIVMKNY